MRGQENVDIQIGHKLKEGLVRSLYVKGEVENLINTSFLKFDDNWIEIVCTDEQTIVRIVTIDIEKYNLNDGDFEFRIQPISKLFPGFKKFINKELIGFKELVLKESEFMSFGLNFYFEDGLNFIIRNHDYPRDENEFLFRNTDFEDLVEK